MTGTNTTRKENTMTAIIPERSKFASKVTTVDSFGISRGHVSKLLRGQTVAASKGLNA